MNTETTITLIIGVLTVVSTIFAAVLAAVLPNYLSERQARNRQRYKLFYIKVYQLNRKIEGMAPRSEAFIERLGKKIPVYDELHYYRLNIFNSPQKGFTITDRSSGAVDLQILHPYQHLVFTDKKAGNIEGMITQTLHTDSSVYFTRAIFYNGFQPGAEDVSIKMERETEEARLIIDFTAVPNHEKLIVSRPQGFFVTTDGAARLERTVEVQELNAGIYALNSSSITSTRRKKYLKPDDVLRMEFNINWELIDTLTMAEAT